MDIANKFYQRVLDLYYQELGGDFSFCEKRGCLRVNSTTKPEQLNDMYFFSSTLPIGKQEELERLFFFNMNQGEFRTAIIRLVQLYGEPTIVEKNNQLQIELEKVDCQNIFVTKNENLVGVIIFNRNLYGEIELVHIVVDEKFSSSGVYADEKLVHKMISELKKIAIMIKGVNNISIKYEQERKFNLKRKKFNAAGLCLGFSLSLPSKHSGFPG